MEALLARSVPSSPIPEERIRATVQLAGIQARSRRRRLLGTAGASGLVLLVAATFWRWSGENSDTGLDFAAALNITRGYGDYERGRVQSAAGKVFRDAYKLLRLLRERDAAPATMLQAVTDALTGPRPAPISYTQGYELVVAKLQSGQPLDPADEVTATAAVCAAASAFRELRERDPVLIPTADNLLKSLGNAVERFQQ